MDKRRGNNHYQRELRRQAEDQLEKRIGHLRGKLDSEALRLLEELKTSQVELELQNEELRRTQEELEESRAAYIDLYDFAPLGYLTLDETGRILRANLTAESLLLTERATLEGSLLLTHIHPEDRDDFYRHLREVTAGKQQAVCELRLLKDGESFEAQLKSMPVHRNHWHFECRTSVTDISERKRLERELVRWQKYEALELLAGGIAHDFNNLLTAMLGNISLARLYLDAEPESKAREKMAVAEKAAMRARELTRQLISFSRRGTPVKEVYDTAALIREKAELPLKTTNCRSKLDLPAGLWAVKVDAGQMGQVVQNLIINAGQAMPEGGTITIQAENMSLDAGDRTLLPPGRYVRIAVRDEGMGIPKERLNRIFDPYFSTKPGGSGLGLAVSQAIVNKHGGKLEVESRPGKGTTFFIFLPASKETVGERKVEEEQEEIAVGRGRILVMDDEKSVREIAAELLRHLGYEVEVAANGEEALELYTRALRKLEPFDAVVLDLVVPGSMGGEETLSRLREIHPQVKAIVSSGYSNNQVAKDYRAHGFRASIPKPYRLTEMSRIIQEVVAGEDQAGSSA